MTTRSHLKPRSLVRSWKLAMAATAVLVIVGAWHTLGLQAQAVATTFEGTLNIVWGDPDPDFGSGGEIRYTLTLPDGSVVALQLAGQEGTAATLFGKRVIVSGRVLANQGQPANALTAGVLVDALTASDAVQAAPLALVTGTRRVIYLLVKFSDDAAVPHPPDFYTDLNNPDTPPVGAIFPTTINGFFKKTSANQFSWLGDVGGVGGLGAPGGWLTLPHTKNDYAPCGSGSSCANLTALANDATALGRAEGINFKNYDNINFVLSNDLDCCAWGGGYSSSVDAKSYGATWEPPWGQNATTYSHEMGHSIGLPHSGWVYYAYDSPWDVMSSGVAATSLNCGSYNSANNSGAQRTLVCTEPGDGYIAGHRDFLGWIPAANQVVTDPLSSVTVALEGAALPLAAGIKMIKVCLPGFSCTGSTARYFTIEARVRGLGTASQFDNGIPGEGVVIHALQFNRPAIGGSCFFNSQSGWAVPIDATPGDYDSLNCSTGGRSYPNYGLYNAQWLPGQTYINYDYAVRISVLSRTGSTFMVSVNGVEPLAPASLAAVASGFTQARLSWTGSPGATSYRVKRGTSAGNETTIATGVITTNYTDNAVTKGQRYYYVVSAVNVVGEGANSAEVSVTLPAHLPRGDFDGDEKADIPIYRPSTGQWFVRYSSQNYGTGSYGLYQWGQGTDRPLAADFDGDGKLDLVVYRPSTGQWFISYSSQNYSTSTYGLYQWGGGGDTPLVADFDGDGKADLVVYRPSTGQWFIRYSSQNYSTSTYGLYQWGSGGDTPLVADFDGDAKTDLIVYRPSTGEWFVRYSSQGYSMSTYSSYQWGSAGDTPLLADFDGDAKADLAVYRASTGHWFIRYSSRGYSAVTYGLYQWGAAGDTPLVTDFDGDGKADLVVYRASTGQWFILYSSQGYDTGTYGLYQWGAGGDTPAP